MWLKTLDEPFTEERGEMILEAMTNIEGTRPADAVSWVLHVDEGFCESKQARSKLQAIVLLSDGKIIK